MPTNPHDTIAFGASAARNGYTATAAVADSFAGRTAGNDFETKAAGFIGCATCTTAAIANVTGARFRHSRDPNWITLQLFGAKDQTGAVDLHSKMYLSYPFKSGAILNCQIGNGNNAQYDFLILDLCYGAGPPLPVPAVMPMNAKWIYGAATDTLVAGTWTNCTITWSEAFEKDVVYDVIGMAAHSATNHAARLLFAGSSPTRTFYPGVLGGDTQLLNHPSYGDFGQFRGDQPPNAQFLATAGDTAEYVALLVVDPALAKQLG